jgi:hypothetical protein
LLSLLVYLLPRLYRSLDFEACSEFGKRVALQFLKFLDEQSIISVSEISNDSESTVNLSKYMVSKVSLHRGQSFDGPRSHKAE